MRLILIAFLLCSCSPYMDVKHGIVHAGFLSATQGFSGKMQVPGVGSVVWSVTNTDGTSVANNALGTISTVSAGNNLLKGLQSNNGVKVNAARQTTARAANARPPTVTTTAVDPTTGQVLTPTVTQPAKAIVP